MAGIHVKEYITDEYGNKKSVVIDIEEYNHIKHILPLVDPDAEVFDARRHEKSFPLEECDEILHRLEELKSTG